MRVIYRPSLAERREAEAEPHDVVAQARGDAHMALHKGPVVSAQWSRGKILALGTSVRLQGIPGSNPGWALFCRLLLSLPSPLDC